MEQPWGKDMTDTQTIQDTIDSVRVDLTAYHPKTVLLFGSGARYLQKIQEKPPSDLDLFYVGSFTPRLPQDLPMKVDLHTYTEYEIVQIARSLRYSPKSLSRAKMYMKDTWQGTLRSDIAACLLLGPEYEEYGFLQMENETVFRDYSIHVVIHGEDWWRAIQKYTQEHRGLKGLFFDKALGNDRFKPPS